MSQFAQLNIKKNLQTNLEASVFGNSFMYILAYTNFVTNPTQCIFERSKRNLVKIEVIFQIEEQSHGGGLTKVERTHSLSKN